MLLWEMLHQEMLPPSRELPEVYFPLVLCSIYQPVQKFLMP